MNAVASARGQNAVYERGQWQVDLRRRELLSDGVAVPIGARAFEIVELLVQSVNELVTKNDILNGVWPGVTIGENTLQVHISAIRKALGLYRAMLTTVSGRGYRLTGDWTSQQQGSPTERTASHLTGEAGTPPENNFPLIAGRLIGREAAARHVRDLVSAYGRHDDRSRRHREDLACHRGGPQPCHRLQRRRMLCRTGLPDGSRPHAVHGRQCARAEAQRRNIGQRGRTCGWRETSYARARYCEHVIDAAAGLAERFTHLCPNTTILMTSREILRIDGEAVYRVPPLDVPGLEQEMPDHILGHSAVELFITRTNA